MFALQMPVASTVVGNGKAINRLDFEKDGKKVGLGASDGRLHVYDIGEVSLLFFFFCRLGLFLVSRC
jgi:hypothetical protein